MSAEMIIERFEGNAVAFHQGDAYVNATQMCAPFQKRPVDFLRLPSTKHFIEVLAKETGALCENLTTDSQGGNLASTQQGTWMHPDLALECARWLSPKFSIWCNRTIRRILSGATSVNAEAASLPAEEPPLLLAPIERENVWRFAYHAMPPVQRQPFGNFVKRRANAFGLLVVFERDEYLGDVRAYPVPFLKECIWEWRDSARGSRGRRGK